MDSPPDLEPVTELRRGRLWRRAPPQKRSPHPPGPTPSSSSAAPTSSTSPSPCDPPNPNPYFCCNICLEAAKEPVVTRCGHLFCWRCLYRWVDLHSPSRDCPVCKSPVDGDGSDLAVVPIYGSPLDVPHSDRTDDVPPRPAAGVPRRPPPRGSPAGDTIEEVRRTAEVIGARVQLQALRRTMSAIDRVLVSLQTIEDIVTRLGAIHREITTGSRGEDAPRGTDAQEDGIYHRTRRRRRRRLSVDQ